MPAANPRWNARARKSQKLTNSTGLKIGLTGRVKNANFRALAKEGQNTKNLVGIIMKIVRSLKTLKNRDKNCQLVKRRGKVYVINKKKRRYKARQA